VITEPACIYIPKGYAHGPVTVKSVNKPIFVLRSGHAARYSPGWDVKNESDCVTRLRTADQNGGLGLALSGQDRIGRQTWLSLQNARRLGEGMEEAGGVRRVT